MAKEENAKLQGIGESVDYIASNCIMQKYASLSEDELMEKICGYDFDLIYFAKKKLDIISEDRGLIKKLGLTGKVLQTIEYHALILSLIESVTADDLPFEKVKHSSE